MGSIWVDIFKLGTEVHHGGDIVQLTEEFASSLLQNFDRLTGEGAEIVVLKEHDRDGYVYGIVEGLRVWDDFVQASMRFMREQDRTAFNAGLLRRFSPGFSLNFTHPHTGEKLGPTLLEVSFTSMPFQTNLRPPQNTNPGVRLALSYAGELITPSTEEESMENTETYAAESVEDEEAAEASEFNAEEAYSDLSKRLAAIEEYMSEDGEEDEEEDKEMSDSDRQIEELSRQVRRLEDEKTRAELKANGITEGHERFIRLRRNDEQLYLDAVELHRKKPQSVQPPIGKPGTEAVSGVADAQALIEMAADAGCTLSNGKLSLWLAKNGHQERIDEVRSVATD